MKNVMDIEQFKKELFSGIDCSWNDFFQEQFSLTYFQDLLDNLLNECNTKTVYPSINNIFRVFKDNSLNMIKVVILGQDPYHTPLVADGLAFSSKSLKIPPSLKNIFKELNNDLGIVNSTADLSKWSMQGIMLLNTVLSVEEHKANSHSKLGWNEFVVNTIKYLDLHNKVVFVLWGNKAKLFNKYIMNSEIIEGYHPSPLAGNKFFNQHYFSRINRFLNENNLQEIDWSLHEKI
ncbi:uracil-DNA glycosylase [Mycoplasma sp. P36-A1]|uniref:uracil-DNA glycosylase n=1 Tax=Mycoplasma sp. P36-A1 TaxID=3252900 RepID=UPI003C2B638B